MQTSSANAALRECQILSARHIRLLGIGGLYIFSLGAFGSPPLAAAGLIMMFIAFLWQISTIRKIWRDPLFWTSILFGIYLVIRTFAAIIIFPQTGADQIEKAYDLFQLGFFFSVLVAFWLADDPRRIPRILVFALIGFLVKICVHLNWNDLAFNLRGRPGFGMPANAFGLYSAIVVLALLLAAPDIWNAYRNRFLKAFIVLLWLILMAIFLEGVILSQSAGAFVACVVVFPPLLTFKAYAWIKDNSLSTKKRLLGLLLLLCAVACFFIFNRQLLTSSVFRVVEKINSIHIIAAGESSNLERADGQRERFDAWRYGVVKWLERPLFGWGPGSSPMLLRASGLESIIGGPKENDPTLNDFHNSYIEILVQIGIIGFLFFVISFHLVIKTVWQAYKKHCMDLTTFLIVIGALSLFAIATSFNLHTDNHLGRHFIILFLGISYAFKIKVN